MSDSELALTQRAKINRIHEEMVGLPQRPMVVRDLFAPDIYMRELTCPAGSTIVGAIHTTEHFSIVSAGAMVIETEAGRQIVRAPCTLRALPGSPKRVGYALEDTVWTTIHANPTNTTDVAELVAQLTTTTLDQLAGGSQNIQLTTSGLGEHPCHLLSLP